MILHTHIIRAIGGAHMIIVMILIKTIGRIVKEIIRSIQQRSSPRRLRGLSGGAKNSVLFLPSSNVSHHSTRHSSSPPECSAGPARETKSPIGASTSLKLGRTTTESPTPPIGETTVSHVDRNVKERKNRAPRDGGERVFIWSNGQRSRERIILAKLLSL